MITDGNCRGQELQAGRQGADMGRPGRGWRWQGEPGDNDGDGDGKISMEEFAATTNNPMMRRITRYQLWVLAEMDGWAADESVQWPLRADSGGARAKRGGAQRAHGF